MKTLLNFIKSSQVLPITVTVLAIFLLSMALMAPLWAQGHDHHMGHSHGAGPSAPQPMAPQPSSPEPSAPPVSSLLYSGVGTVKALDLNNLTVTLDHGPIPALNWPAMVMDFQVEGADLLEGLAVGDRVTFDFRAQRSTFLIIDLEKQR